MIEAKLKTGLWVQAQVRQCDLNLLPAMVRRKGDPDAGAVVLVLDRLDGTADVFAQARDTAGRLGWIRGVGVGPVDSSQVEQYIADQASFDPDLWVLEIEDPQGRYQLDGTIIA